MARDYITIGSTPCDEECAQVGTANYSEKAKEECARFIRTIRRVCGEEPEGASLAIKSFPHDFGTYHEVVCWFDEEIEDSIDYAFFVEAYTPCTWRDEVNKWKPKGERK